MHVPPSVKTTTFLLTSIRFISSTMCSPYDGRWSKTMMGYGSEDDHFVLELTYNYGIKSYALGNDYQHITIHSTKAVKTAKSHPGITIVTEEEDGTLVVKDPDAYTFRLVRTMYFKTES